MLFKILHWTLLPIFALGGTALGQAFGPFIGFGVGVAGWEHMGEAHDQAIAEKKAKTETEEKASEH